MLDFDILLLTLTSKTDHQDPGHTQEASGSPAELWKAVMGGASDGAMVSVKVEGEAINANEAAFALALESHVSLNASRRIKVQVQRQRPHSSSFRLSRDAQPLKRLVGRNHDAELVKQAKASSFRLARDEPVKLAMQEDDQVLKALSRKLTSEKLEVAKKMQGKD